MLQAAHTSTIQAKSIADKGDFFISLSKCLRLFLFFSYSTLPMWRIWLLEKLGDYQVSSVDIIIPFIWLPVSAAIIALSFMTFGWKQPIKGLVTFLFYNSLALVAVQLFVGL